MAEFEAGHSRLDGVLPLLARALKLEPEYPFFASVLANKEERYFRLLPIVKITGYDQFEAIHPFLDGNGRVGRLLITLFRPPTLFNKPIFISSVGRWRLVHDRSSCPGRANGDRHLNLPTWTDRALFASLPLK